jgi:NitT/TauT family transport system substrate-binding protein
MRRRILATCLAVVFLLIATACGDPALDEPAAEDGDGAAEGDLTPLRWGVATEAIGPAQAHYSSLPDALGYWEDEGLDVEVLGFAGSGAVAQALDADQVDAGTITPGPLFPAVAGGADFVAFYDTVTRNYLVPGVVEDSDIQEVADFPGKTVGVQSLESGVVPMIEMMLAREGLDPDSVEFVTIGTGAEAASFIERDQVEIVGLWDSPRAEIEVMGQPLREIADEVSVLAYHHDSARLRLGVLDACELEPDDPPVVDDEVREGD